MGRVKGLQAGGLRMQLRIAQSHVGNWSKLNFPDNTPLDPFIGIVEEVGELAHALLKQKQKIRQTDTNFQGQVEDALGDILIYMLDFAERNGIDLEYCLAHTWNEVSKRDWIKFPKNGRTE
jgi:NTP pyrophosphatase (non-canonical NTP hydrolase)